MAGLLDPYYKVPGHEGLRNKQPRPVDDRIWQERVRDFGNEWANYMFGPHLPSVEGLLEFSDANDIQDAANNNQELSSAVWDGRWGDAAKAAPWAGISSLAAVIPGVSAGPFDNVARRATDVAQSSPRIGHNGGPSIDPLASVDLPAGSDPRYLGAAPDRSGGDYPRYSPSRGVPARMQRIFDQATDPNSPLGSIFDKHIAKGKTLGGEDWYNTEELRDWFVGELGEERGNAEWMDYMKKIGATSTGAKVPQNIRFASFYRALGDDAPRVAALVNEKGITPAEAAKELGIKVANMPDNFNYGHVKQRNQASNIVKQYDGQWELQPPPDLKGAKLTKWLQANPKVKGFYNDLVGNKKNIAADMHFMRMLAMADGGADFLSSQAKLNSKQLDELVAHYGDDIKKYIGKRDVKGKDVIEVNLANAVNDGVITDTSLFKGGPDRPAWAAAWADTPGPTEYAMYEDMANKVAARYGMTPAQFQASLWMGAGELTGLADESQGTFMELFRRSLDKRANERGITRKEMLQDFIRNKAPLAVAPMVGIPAVSGLLSNDDEEPVY